jgi:hypothetical protein
MLSKEIDSIIINEFIIHLAQIKNIEEIHSHKKSSNFL